MGVKQTQKLEKTRQSKTAFKNIEKNAQDIVNTPGAIKQTGPSKWSIISQTVSKMFYAVILCESGFLCECPAAHGGARLCKHVAGLHLKLTKMWNKKRKKLDIKKVLLKCKKCGSRNFGDHGYRKCTKKKPTKRYICNKCGATTSGLDGFSGRHFDVMAIVTSLSMAACGMSPQRIMEHHKKSGICMDISTIKRWIAHYSGIANTYWNSLKIDAGYMWHIDEIEIMINGQKRYLLAVLDNSSRLVLAYMVSDTKKSADITPMLVRAASHVLRLPRVLVSDGLQAFIVPVQNVFNKMRGKQFVHIRDIHLQNQFNSNNIYERFNGEVLDFLGNIRGLKIEDSGMIHLMMWYHNCFRPHMGIQNMTPAKAAGITIENNDDYGGWGDWVTFIQNATIYAYESIKQK